MIIQAAILIFILYVLSRVTIRFRRGDITGREFGVWIIFWLLVAAATLWPQGTDIFAQAVGVGRGADLLVYISVIVLFFIIFKLLVKVEKIERDITKVVRNVALEDKSEDKKQEMK